LNYELTPIGRVESPLTDRELDDVDRIARHYGLSGGYPVRDRPRVSAWIEVAAWHAWGF
jgi:hypothetical protein